MVIATAETDILTVPVPVQESAKVVDVRDPIPFVRPPVTKKLCPRCDSRLTKGYEEMQCLNCGYADYSSEPDHLKSDRKNVLSTATKYILRYVGTFPSLVDTLTYVKLIRVRNRVVFAVNCPFCEKTMDQASLSGKRPEVREQRFKCLEGHRVSLVPIKNGMLGWR